jgi:hypothetical protein
VRSTSREHESLDSSLAYNNQFTTRSLLLLHFRDCNIYTRAEVEMEEPSAGKPHFFLKYTPIAAVLGLATGSIIGQLAGGSVFFLWEYGLGTSLAIWLVFAGIGVLLGSSLDIDARERTVSRSAVTTRSRPSERP